jgi:hypothetical protein
VVISILLHPSIPPNQKRTTPKLRHFIADHHRPTFGEIVLSLCRPHWIQTCHRSEIAGKIKRHKSAGVSGRLIAAGREPNHIRRLSRGADSPALEIYWPKAKVCQRRLLTGTFETTAVGDESEMYHPIRATHEPSTVSCMENIGR